MTIMNRKEGMEGKRWMVGSVMKERERGEKGGEKECEVLSE